VASAFGLGEENAESYSLSARFKMEEIDELAK